MSRCQWLLSAIGILLVLGAAGTLSAQETASPGPVAVLGLDSPDGDDRLTAALTTALRDAFRVTESWSLVEAEVSLRQMLLLSRCTRPSDRCLTRVANTLNASRVLVGTLERSTNRQSFLLSLSVFNAATRSHDRQLRDELPVEALTESTIPGLSRHYVAYLAGLTDESLVRVRPMLGRPTFQEAASDPDITVSVDGESLEAIGAGVFAGRISPGPHRVEVRAAGHHPHRSRFTVQAGTPTWLEPELTAGLPSGHPGSQEEDDGVPNWVPWTLTGLSATSTVATVLLWLELDAIGDTNWFFFLPVNAVENDPQVERYRTTANPNFPGLDYCEAARMERTLGSVTPEQRDLAAHVDDACGRASTFQIVSAITLSVALAAAVAAVVTFIDPFGDGDDRRTSESLELSLLPLLNTGPQGTSLGLSSVLRY